MNNKEQQRTTMKNLRLVPIKHYKAGLLEFILKSMTQKQINILKKDLKMKRFSFNEIWNKTEDSILFFY
jgi:hypothetical protein